MKRPARLALFALAMVFAMPAWGEIYKWKDKDGKTHFSDRPPRKTDGNVVIPTRPKPSAAIVAPELEADEEAAATEEDAGSSPAVPDAAAPKANSQAERDQAFRQRRAEAAEAQARADKQAAQAVRREQDCQRARTQHQALVSGQRVSRPTGDGGRVFLNDDERAAEIQRTQELVDAFCTEG